MAPPLFVYGTLMDAQIMALLLGRVPVGGTIRQGRAYGFRAVLMPQRSYPGLARAAGEWVAGQIVSGLAKEDWRRLDNFEGEEYVRSHIKVQTANGWLAAQAYFPAVEPPADVPGWSFEFWVQNHKAEMLESGANSAGLRP